MRGKFILAVTLTALATAPSWAVECRVGPMTVDVPTCDVKQGTFPTAQYIEWQDDAGTARSIVVVPQKRKPSIKHYYAEWRSNRKCTGTVRATAHHVPFTKSDSRPVPPHAPQMAWGGNCAAGDSYIVQAIALKTQVVELHVWQRMRGDTSKLEQAFASLLEQVRLAP
jgi:hypothetical protein